MEEIDIKMPEENKQRLREYLKIIAKQKQSHKNFLSLFPYIL